MKRVLIVQRSLTHYRKLLLNYIQMQGEYEIDVVSIANSVSHDNNCYAFTAKEIMRYKNYHIEYSKGMIDFIKKQYKNYDYIILEGATNIINNMSICRFLKKNCFPYVVWDAGRRKNSKMSLLRRLMQTNLEYVWKNAAAIIAYSTYAKKYFEEIGISENKIYVCQNTVYVKEFDNQIQKITPGEIEAIRKEYAPDKRKLVLYVGAVEPRKRIKDLIDAISIINDKTMSTNLVVIGGGEQLEELKEYAVNRKDVYLLGTIIDDVIKYFMAADLFVLPSEGGLSLNQAMICGKPIIASSADGTELDLVEDGKNGFLFEEKDIHELVHKITSILENEKMCEVMGKRSREIIEQKVNEVFFYQNFRCCLESICKNR